MCAHLLGLPRRGKRTGRHLAFAFFACMMAVQLVVVFFMPETKGGTIEDIESVSASSRAVRGVA